MKNSIYVLRLQRLHLTIFSFYLFIFKCWSIIHFIRYKHTASFNSISLNPIVHTIHASLFPRSNKSPGRLVQHLHDLSVVLPVVPDNADVAGDDDDHGADPGHDEEEGGVRDVGRGLGEGVDRARHQDALSEYESEL